MLNLKSASKAFLVFFLICFSVVGFAAGGNTWSTLSTTNAPDARDHTAVAVWTGSKMIIWGGITIGGTTNTGSIYDPSNDNWTAISTSNAPSPRAWATAVWSGTEMLVWGGDDSNGNSLNTGAAYNPLTDTWRTITTTGAPTARSAHTAVWTGSSMIIWGGTGKTTGNVNTGATYTYNAGTGAESWTPLSTTNAPSARFSHTAVTTTSRMLIWGGVSGTETIEGGAVYDIATNSWGPMTQVNAPSQRQDHSAVMAGNKMIIWGGIDSNTSALLNNGASYDFSADKWTAIPTENAPTGRYQHTAVWTGSQMIIWGGLAGPFSYDKSYTNTGGIYDPVNNIWVNTSLTNAPIPRAAQLAVWANSSNPTLIVWGGDGGGNTGGSFTSPLPNVGFSGDFAPSKWSVGKNPPYANLINTSNAPNSITLINYKKWKGSGVGMGYVAQSDLKIRFKWTYYAYNYYSQTNCPASFINGSDFILLSSKKPYTLQAGYSEFNIKKGDQFAFALNGAKGSACLANNNQHNLSLTISDFLAIER